MKSCLLFFLLLFCCAPVGARTLVFASIDTSEQLLLDLVARVAPGPELEIASERGGLLENLLVRSQQVVDSGELMARLNDDELERRLEIASLELEQARANYDRVRRLRQRELASQERFDDVELAWKRSRVEYRYWQRQRDKLAVRAPEPLLVERVLVQPGQHLAPMQPLVRAQLLGQVYLEAQVPAFFGNALERARYSWQDEQRQWHLLDRPERSPVRLESGNLQLIFREAQLEDLEPNRLIPLRMHMRSPWQVVPFSAVFIDDGRHLVFTWDRQSDDVRPVELREPLVFSDRLGFRLDAPLHNYLVAVTGLASKADMLRYLRSDARADSRRELR